MLTSSGIWNAGPSPPSLTIVVSGGRAASRWCGFCSWVWHGCSQPDLHLPRVLPLIYRAIYKLRLHYVYTSQDDKITTRPSTPLMGCWQYRLT